MMFGDTKTYLIDIDGTICSQTKNNNYMKAEPNVKMIAKINVLYGEGHNIKVFTSRGSSSGIDWYTKTREQLKTWHLKYHQLIMGKPSADVIVDDIAISPKQFLEKEG